MRAHLSGRLLCYLWILLASRRVNEIFQRIDCETPWEKFALLNSLHFLLSINKREDWRKFKIFSLHTWVVARWRWHGRSAAEISENYFSGRRLSGKFIKDPWDCDKHKKRFLIHCITFRENCWVISSCDRCIINSNSICHMKSSGL